MLFAAVALTGVLASVGMQTLTGPVTTITRVTQKNIADNNLLMNGKIIVNAAVTGTVGGDPDSDGMIEPAPFVAAGGGEQAPEGGGFLPNSLGLALTDPWGSRFGYCVWDHGTVNSSSGRITGDNTVTAPTQPVIAIIAAGPDKLFQTNCTAYTGGPVAVAKVSGSDDLVFRYTYAEATASSNGLWTLNPTDQTQAQLKDASGVANVTIDRSTGLGRFFGIVTDTLAAATSILTIDGGLKLDTETNVTTCGAGEAGVVRYNAVASKLEVCNGSVWKPAGSSEATYITQTPSEDLSSEQALSLLPTGVMKVTTGSGTVSSGAVDLSGAEATGILAAGRFPALLGEVTTIEGSLTTTVADDILDFSELKDGLTLDASTDIAIDGEKVLSLTNTGTGASFLVRDDADDLTPFVIDATGRVGIGTASPELSLDVAGSARLLAGGALEFGGADTLIRGNAGTNVLTFFTAGLERLRISPQGNVGIGDVDPNAKLVVAGGLRIGTHTECLGAANNGTIRYDTISKKMQLCVDGAWSSVSGIERLDDIGDVEAPAPADNDILAWNATENRWESKNINAVGPAQVTVAGANGSIQFKAGSDLAADTANLHYDDANNRLGVGTNVPAETLDVAGTARISGHLALGSTASIVSRLVVGSTALWADDASRRVGIGTATPVATLDVAGGIRLADDAAACTLAKEGTLRFAAGRLQFCFNNEWSDVGLVSGPGMGGPTPDAIDCGVSGTKRVLYLQSVTATHYVYGFIAAAQGLGLQITYDKTGNHISTYNPSAWTGASACDGKTMAQLGAEGRIYYLSGGPGGQQSGLAYGPDGYVQFAAGGALSGASEFVWNNVDKRLGIRVAAPVTALDVSGGVKIGTDSQCGTNPSKAGMLVWNANTLQVCTSAGTFLSIADAGGLAESDPQVSAVTDAKWCRGTGAAVTCDVDPISAGITALTGDVTAIGPGSAVATITTGAVTTTKIADGTIVTADVANEAITSDKIADGGVATNDLANGAVTLTKMADLASGRLLGRSTAGSGPVETISVGAGLVLSSGTLAAGNIDASRITADTLDFTEFKDAMTLDASTDILASLTNVLSVTNTGTGNSFVVNDQASDTTPFVIDASGNVGIGTTTPSTSLHIESNGGGLVVGALGSPFIELRRTAASQSDWRFQHTNNGFAIQNAWVTNPFASVLTIEDGTGILSTSSLHIKGNGNVGIGSTAPSERLSVGSVPT
ncbi:MAG: hypothetical protein EBS23_01840 [Betaproteobacteria bacterium]|nr:hypothetical protein [Betaproteobacteria bacterium]